MKGGHVLQKVCSQSKLFLKRNSATILTGVGSVGVVATVATAIQSTPKALSLINEAKETKGEELTKWETVKVAAPVYIPTFVLGTATIACIIGANVLNKRQQASMASAYALLETSYKEYKKKVNELYGEDANDKIETEIAKDKYEETAIEVEDNKQLFYDEFSRTYFESTIEAVQQAEYYLNRDIMMRGWVELSEFYEALDIDTPYNDAGYGWSDGGNLARYWQAWVDFNHHKVVMEDGLECTIIKFWQEPYVEWEGY